MSSKIKKKLAQDVYKDTIIKKKEENIKTNVRYRILSGKQNFSLEQWKLLLNISYGIKIWLKEIIFTNKSTKMIYKSLGKIWEDYGKKYKSGRVQKETKD